jgi:hypothetical protein
MSNLRSGLTKALVSPDKDKKADLYNRLRDHASRNLSNPMKPHGYGSYAVSPFKTVAAQADSERRKRDEEAKSIVNKEWYKELHWKANNAQK